MAAKARFGPGMFRVSHLLLGSDHRWRGPHTRLVGSLNECTAEDLAGLRKTAAEFCFPPTDSWISTLKSIPVQVRYN